MPLCPPLPPPKQGAVDAAEAPLGLGQAGQDQEQLQAVGRAEGEEEARVQAAHQEPQRAQAGACLAGCLPPLCRARATCGLACSCGDGLADSSSPRQKSPNTPKSGCVPVTRAWLATFSLGACYEGRVAGETLVTSQRGLFASARWLLEPRTKSPNAPKRVRGWLAAFSLGACFEPVDFCPLSFLVVI